MFKCRNFRSPTGRDTKRVVVEEEVEDAEARAANEAPTTCLINGIGLS